MARLATALPANTVAADVSRLARPCQPKTAALLFQLAGRYDGLVGKTARSAVFPQSVQRLAGPGPGADSPWRGPGRSPGARRPRLPDERGGLLCCVEFVAGFGEFGVYGAEALG